MIYSVQTRAIADALQAHWDVNWNLKIHIVSIPKSNIWQLRSDEAHPYWREVNDAFVSGWKASSLVTDR